MGEKALIFFLCGWLLFPAYQVAGSPSDSLVLKQLLQEAIRSAADDPDQATILFEKVSAQAKKSGLKGMEADVLFQYSSFLFDNLQYTGAIENLEEAGQLYKTIGEKVREARCYELLGVVYQYTGDYASSLKTLFEGLPVATEAGSPGVISSIYTNIGLAYKELNDPDNALLYFQKSSAIEKRIGDTAALGIVLHNIADAYNRKQEYAKSINYYKKAIRFHLKAGNNAFAATSTSDMAGVFFALHEVDSALFYKRRAVAVLEKEGPVYLSDYCYALTSLGNILATTNRLTEAKVYLKKCTQCSLLLDDRIYAKIYYNFHYEYYKNNKDLNQAIHFLELLNAVKDSIAQESSSFENQRIAIRYDFDKKTKENALQYQLQLSLRENKATAYQSRMYLAIAIGAVLLAIAGFFTNRLRITQRLKRIRELEQVRHDIAGDLHDDVGSTLSSIQIMSAIAQQESGENEKVKASIGTITQLADKVSMGIREIVWSANPANDKIEALARRLQELAAGSLDCMGITFLFLQELEDPEQAINPHVRKDLIMIYKEALTNICKYSESPQVDIRLTQQKNLLSLSIKDYGRGFDPLAAHPAGELHGNGLENMKRRAAAMNASIIISSEPEIGTEISLQVALP